MSGEFYSVQALATPDNTKSVYWRMAGDFNPKGRDMEFYVDVAEESLGDWTELNTGSPITDGCVFVDTTKYRYGMTSDTWYRVRLILKDPAQIEPDVVIESVPAQLMGALSDRAYLVGRAILDGMYTKLKKGGGQQGFLLKKKIWGDRCPTCTDYDVETVLNGHCPVCYGTGIVGGYHEGIEFWIMPGTVQTRGRTESPIGVQNEYDITAQCAAYPWLDKHDVWVDAKTNERFLIEKISHQVELERKPIILNIQLAKISNTDVTMDVPIADETEEFVNENYVTEEVNTIPDKFPVTDDEVIKSDIASEDRGWRRGLEGDDW
jgi:hypothetical protein